MEEPNLTISQAFDTALADKPKGESSANPPDGSKTVENVEKPQTLNVGKTEVKPEAKGDEKKEPTINPDTGKYDGEYSKDRFNGLMSAWQKDRAMSKEVPTLKQKIEELEKLVKQPQQKSEDNQQEDLPPELQSADPETQAGFRLLMKANDGKLSQLEEKIVGKIMETLNRPLKEQNETTTKIQQEVEELSVEYGDDFAKRVNESKKYAAENNYPLGTLRQAYLAMLKDEKIAQYEGKAKNGKKTLEEIEAEKAKQAGIPVGGANRYGESPKWDEKRDGNKDLSTIFSDIKSYL